MSKGEQDDGLGSLDEEKLRNDNCLKGNIDSLKNENFIIKFFFKVI